ncbi:MAG: sulfotransferase family protein [Pseudomonadales bacterium]
MWQVLKDRIPDRVKNRTRNFRRSALHKRIQWRAMYGGERQTPTFLVIGAMKAGTTSLFRYLCEHPQIAPPITKEVNYFNFNWTLGSQWYAAHFPFASPLSTQITGEASPGYLVHPRAALRVSEQIPDARVIVLLRDPVARTLSHYFHQRRIEREHRPLEEALFSDSSYAAFDLPEAQEASWLEALNANPRSGTNAAKLLASCPLHRAYISGSLYVKHLAAWFERFDPDQILVMSSEDLFRRPDEQYRRVLDFIGLEFVSQENMRAHNVGKYPDSVNVDTVARLKSEFFEPNLRLYELIGTDLGWNH